MRITPLRPIGKNGLRGFGFSVHFDNPELPAPPAGDRAGEVNPPPASPATPFDPWRKHGFNPNRTGE